MQPNEDALNAELEKLIRDAQPTLEPVSQNQLAYSAGVAAGREKVLRSDQFKSGRTGWMWMASHAVCALAASWITFAILPTPDIPTADESISRPANNPTSMAQVDQPKDRSAVAEPMPEGILNPRINPSRLVDFISNRQQSVQLGSPTDNEPILNSRSILF